MSLPVHGVFTTGVTTAGRHQHRRPGDADPAGRDAAWRPGPGQGADERVRPLSLSTPQPMPARSSAPAESALGTVRCRCQIRRPSWPLRCDHFGPVSGWRHGVSCRRHTGTGHLWGVSASGWVSVRDRDCPRWLLRSGITCSGHALTIQTLPVPGLLARANGLQTVTAQRCADRSICSDHAGRWPQAVMAGVCWEAGVFDGTVWGATAWVGGWRGGGCG